MAFSNLAAAAISLTLLVAPVAQAQEILVCSLEAPPLYGAGAGGHNTPVQGYLGIMFHDVSDSTYNSQHLRDKRGAEIVMVDHDGPAGKAGLREHDVVLSLNGTTVEGEEQLRKLLHDMQPGRTISISVWRDGTERSFTRKGSLPTVVVHDPLQAHRDMLPRYTDHDIHDVTAYLVTLK